MCFRPQKQNLWPEYAPRLLHKPLFTPLIIWPSNPTDFALAASAEAGSARGIEAFVKT